MNVIVLINLNVILQLCLQMCLQAILRKTLRRSDEAYGSASGDFEWTTQVAGKEKLDCVWIKIQ